MQLKIALSVIAAGAVVSFAGSASAQETSGMTLVPSVADMKWVPGPPTLPKGTLIDILNGDPAKPGPFVLRLKFPPNSVVGPHRHATAENLTILTGNLYHEMGEKLDKSHGDMLSAGGFVYLPGMMPHSVWTGATESIIQVTGTGPFGVLYVNPADDPSKSP